MWFVRKSEFEALKKKVEKLETELNKKADKLELQGEVATINMELHDLKSRVASVEVALRDSNVQQMRKEYELFIQQMKQLNLKFLTDAVEEVKQKLDSMVPEITTMEDYGRFKEEVEGRLTKIEDQLKILTEELRKNDNS